MEDTEMVHASIAAAIVRELELVIDDLRRVMPRPIEALRRSHSAPAGTANETGRWLENSTAFLHFAQQTLSRAQAAIGRREPRPRRTAATDPSAGSLTQASDNWQRS